MFNYQGGPFYLEQVPLARKVTQACRERTITKSSNLREIFATQPLCVCKAMQPLWAGALAS